MEILILAVLIGLIPAYIAHKKGRSFFPWWIYGALLFIVALPHAILIKPNLPRMERVALDSGYKKCPRCAEMVKSDAKMCRFCGHNFDLQSRIAGVEVTNKTANTKKASLTTRLILGGVLFAGLIAMWWISTHSPTNIATKQDLLDPEFRVEVSDVRGNLKKSVEVYLRDRVPKAEIEKLAQKLRDENPQFKNFFVRFWLEGVDLLTAWASIDWTPERSKTYIYGLTLEQVKEVTDAAVPDNDGIIGTWLHGSAGGFKITIYKKNGSMFMHRAFPGGKESIGKLFVKRAGDQQRYIDKGDNNKEFWVIDQNGDLQLWDTEEFVTTMPKLSDGAPDKPTLRYEIAETKDLSFGKVRRLNLRVSLHTHYSKDDIVEIARSEIERIIAGQAVNAISIMFFGPGTSTKGAWDVGIVDWAPNGRWSDANTVKSGDYRNFAFSTEYKPPPKSTAKTDALSVSSEKGLLGAPLPASSALTSRMPGDPASGTDPREEYRVQASASAIAEFYLREMPKHGWEKDGTSTDRALFFTKGAKLLGVLINSKGGTFTLMGS